jgi:hypothetical protein
MTPHTKQSSPLRRAALAAGAFLALGAITIAATPGDAPPAREARPSSADTPRALPSQPPPEGAVILFDGKDLSRWTKRGGGPASWKIEDGAMIAGGGDIVTRDTFRDFRLHVEFNVPSLPDKRGQARGNSGVYLNGRYEVQVLDSYGPAIDPPGRPLQKNECGAIYGVAAPRVNATLPPGAWQTYDITFHGPRLGADGTVSEPPRITLVQNGVTVHDNVAVPAPTRAGLGKPGANEGPILLQDHGNPVRYRNIWLVPM